MRETWTDYRGRIWPVVQSQRRLKFSYPAHAALRVHVFHRDGYRCCHCHARAVEVPYGYSGRETLRTDTLTSPGWHDCLVLEHVLTLAAGGRSIVANLQTLCETCNRKKQREDKAAIAEYRGRC